jgi:hypothetical protein
VPIGVLNVKARGGWKELRMEALLGPKNVCVERLLVKIHKGLKMKKKPKVFEQIKSGLKDSISYSRKLKKYKRPSWAVDQLIRENGVVEDICEHGVGHPNLEYLKDNPGRGIHGCDGCCYKKEK